MYPFSQTEIFPNIRALIWNTTTNTRLLIHQGRDICDRKKRIWLEGKVEIEMFRKGLRTFVNSNDLHSIRVSPWVFMLKEKSGVIKLNICFESESKMELGAKFDLDGALMLLKWLD